MMDAEKECLSHTRRPQALKTKERRESSRDERCEFVHSFYFSPSKKKKKMKNENKTKQTKTKPKPKPKPRPETPKQRGNKRTHTKKESQKPTKRKKTPPGMRNLVLSSGGLKGTVHLGALFMLHTKLCMSGKEKGIHDEFQGFAGSSVGALLAFCLAAGHTPASILALQLRFLGKMPMCKAGETPRVEDCLRRGYCSKWGSIEEIIDEVLNARWGVPDLTFRELLQRTGRDLVVCATQLDTPRSVLFRARTTPHVSVRSAVLASMAIPLVFPPYRSRGLCTWTERGCSRFLCAPSLPRRSLR